MKINTTSLPEIKVIQYDKKTDNRGFSHSIYNKTELEKAGIYFEYIEENIYYSEKAGTLYRIARRGIDYAVDLRRGSPTYLKGVGVELSEDNQKQIYIPKGFRHVFLSLEDDTRNAMRFDVPFDARYIRQIVI